MNLPSPFLLGEVMNDIDAAIDKAVMADFYRISEKFLQAVLYTGYLCILDTADIWNTMWDEYVETN